MPSTKGLEILVRKRQPAEKQWLELIESRRELIKPHLDSFTLSELGDLECLVSEAPHKHKLSWDNPKVTGDQRFSLKTQGIFCAQPYSDVERIPGSGYQPFRGGGDCPDGTMRAWGLTRGGLWLLVTVIFAGEEGYKSRGYERAKKVEIVETDVPTIIERTKEKPEEIWETLGNAVKVFAENRKRLYLQADNLAKMVMIEELALSMIPG